ncbi:hypothetical protein FVE85_6203 [Porphyridium purpureum]|uniref:Uncharacterized protein n=1 Tax=Porphyridium purpureum TaxID=35688 RepID=A0A5J4Z5X0_PORPP|nr:hypothetical protein FVE85_6203 [Porphyridium purpureum]|eukprot:POR1129..scf295_1
MAARPFRTSFLTLKPGLTFLSSCVCGAAATITLPLPRDTDADLAHVALNCLADTVDTPVNDTNAIIFLNFARLFHLRSLPYFLWTHALQDSGQCGSMPLAFYTARSECIMLTGSHALLLPPFQLLRWNARDAVPALLPGDADRKAGATQSQINRFTWLYLLVVSGLLLGPDTVERDASRVRAMLQCAKRRKAAEVVATKPRQS